jgi:hypothetical protein
MSFKAALFEPGDYKKKDLWYILMFVFLFGGIAIGAILSLQHAQYAGLISGLLLGMGLVMMLANNWRYAPLKGQLNGFLEISNDAITFADRKVPFIDIEKIEIYALDYYGGRDAEAMRYRKGTPKPCLSQGVSNHLKICTKAGENIVVYFKQEQQSDKLKLIPFMAQLIILDKIHYLKGISMLDLKYTEVKQLKEELSKNNYPV